MAKTPWISKDRGASSRRFALQKSLIEKHFPCFKCRFLHRQLVCEGRITPSDDCDSYDVKITYRFGSIPKVYIVRPEIIPSAAIHVYASGCLCLYFPEDDPWNINDDIHKKIIPWTAEWLVFYELYKIHGKWLGPEASHTLVEREVQAVDALAT